MFIPTSDRERGCFRGFSVKMWLLLSQDRGAAFLASLLTGALIGLVYDFFRIGRVIFKGGRIKLFFDDVLFFVMAALVFAVFTFNATMGVVRMFAAIGALVGFFAYRFSIGLFTANAARTLKRLLTPYIVRAVTFLKYRYRLVVARCYTRRNIRYVVALSEKGFV